MRLFFLSIALLMGGCASNPNVYIEPDERLEGVSKIEGSEVRESLLTWGRYSIFKIDGQSTSFWRWSSYSPLRIMAGHYNFLTYSHFNMSDSPLCPCETFGEIEFTAESGKEYIFKGKVDGIYLATWIEDKKTGQKASIITKSQYRRSAEPVAMPVFIPAK